MRNERHLTCRHRQTCCRSILHAQVRSTPRARLEKSFLVVVDASAALPPSPTLPDPPRPSLRRFSSSRRHPPPPPLLLLPRELLPQRPRAPPVGDGARQDNRVHPVLPRRRRIRDENNPRTVRERERDAEPAPGKRRASSHGCTATIDARRTSAPHRAGPRAESRSIAAAVTVIAVAVAEPSPSPPSSFAREEDASAFSASFSSASSSPPSSSSPGQVFPRPQRLVVEDEPPPGPREHARIGGIFSENLLGA